MLDEQVTLSFSQERVASYGVPLGQLRDILQARNTALSGGLMEVERPDGGAQPVRASSATSGRSAASSSGSSAGGAPLYLRDLVDIDRGYESPPRYLNFYNWADSAGRWHRGRAITLVAPDDARAKRSASSATRWTRRMAVLRDRLPPDLVLARTSDQPLQVEENIESVHEQPVGGGGCSSCWSR